MLVACLGSEPGHPLILRALFAGEVCESRDGLGRASSLLKKF